MLQLPDALSSPVPCLRYYDLIRLSVVRSLIPRQSHDYLGLDCKPASGGPTSSGLFLLELRKAALQVGHKLRPAKWRKRLPGLDLFSCASATKAPLLEWIVLADVGAW